MFTDVLLLCSPTCVDVISFINYWDILEKYIREFITFADGFILHFTDNLHRFDRFQRLESASTALFMYIVTEIYSQIQRMFHLLSGCYLACVLLLRHFDLYRYANRALLEYLLESWFWILISENLKATSSLTPDNCYTNIIKIAFTQYLYYSFAECNLTFYVRTYWANNFKMSLYLLYQGKHRRYLLLIYFQSTGTTFVFNLNWHFDRLNLIA